MAAAATLKPCWQNGIDEIFKIGNYRVTTSIREPHISIVRMNTYLRHFQCKYLCIGLEQGCNLGRTGFEAKSINKQLERALLNS